MSDVEMSAIASRKDSAASNDRPEFQRRISVNWSTEQLGPVQVSDEHISINGQNIHVIIRGEKQKPVIVTFHDIGLNSSTCFDSLFCFNEMQMILKHFCVYHIEAPGHEFGASAFNTEKRENGTSEEGSNLMNGKKSYQFPTMEELGELVFGVIQHYGCKRVIGFGAGAGANVLARVAINHPEVIDGLILINCTGSQAGWGEWAYQKMNIFHLKRGNYTTYAENYLLSYWFGSKQEEHLDLVRTYKQHIQQIEPYNLALFIEAFVNRSDLGITRPTPNSTGKCIRCPVLNIVGDNSPHVDAVTQLNGNLNPTKTTFFKVFDSDGMIMEEHPAKLSEAFLLFVQGLGYIPHLSHTKIIQFKNEMVRRQMSAESDGVVPNDQFSMSNLDKPNMNHRLSRANSIETSPPALPVV